MRKDEGNLATKINWTLHSFRIDELTDYYKNPRSLSEKEFKLLKTSLDKFGMIDKPIVNADSAHTIIGGHQRKHVLETSGVKVLVEIFCEYSYFDDEPRISCKGSYGTERYNKLETQEFERPYTFLQFGKPLVLHQQDGKSISVSVSKALPKD